MPITRSIEHPPAFRVDRGERISSLIILTRDDAIHAILGEQRRPFVQPHIIQHGIVIVIEVAQGVAVDHSPIASRQ